MRFHPSLRAVYKNKRKTFEDDLAYRIIDVTDYDDMQELITIADVAITDYSSWIYDFMLQRRPGFIFATDIALYNNERGFCYPLETTPFPIATNNNEMMQNVLDFNQEDYLNKLEAFLEEKGCVEDGHASERTVDKVLELMKINK
jgi:CDP-glycerol glycerophosphotransferase